MAAHRNPSLVEQEAFAALHVEIIPGTELMRDVGELHFTHAAGKDIV